MNPTPKRLEQNLDLGRTDNNDYKLFSNSLIHFSSFGKFHSVRDKYATKCGIDFMHKDFEIMIDGQFELYGKCKRCEYYEFNHEVKSND